jgi:hypothetical protein
MRRAAGLPLQAAPQSQQAAAAGDSSFLAHGSFTLDHLINLSGVGDSFTAR